MYFQVLEKTNIWKYIFYLQKKLTKHSPCSFEKLQKLLRQYAKEKKITEGCLFRTRSGKPIDRSNIWKEMKKLCKGAGVAKEKVFPHNLRHLFAREFYQVQKDIAKLADVLGHQNIETTRIYIKTTGMEHRSVLNQMKMVMGVRKRS